MRRGMGRQAERASSILTYMLFFTLLGDHCILIDIFIFKMYIYDFGSGYTCTLLWIL